MAYNLTLGLFYDEYSLAFVLYSVGSQCLRIDSACPYYSTNECSALELLTNRGYLSASELKSSDSVDDPCVRRDHARGGPHLWSMVGRLTVHTQTQRSHARKHQDLAYGVL
jgi:hypothetical protein